MHAYTVSVSVGRGRGGREGGPLTGRCGGGVHDVTPMTDDEAAQGVVTWHVDTVLSQTLGVQVVCPGQTQINYQSTPESDSWSQVVCPGQTQINYQSTPESDSWSPGSVPWSNTN